jgi:hypothetical protein
MSTYAGRVLLTISPEVTLEKHVLVYVHIQVVYQATYSVGVPVYTSLHV